MNNPIIKILDMENNQDRTAAALFESVVDLPLICPHTHVSPAIFLEEHRRIMDPARIFILPDHYVLRMLVSQGVPFESLGINSSGQDLKIDSQAIWQNFCELFYLFDGTPTGLWIENTLSMVFGLTEKPGSENAIKLFDQIKSLLASEVYSSRNLFKKFNVETLCTTDRVLDTLEVHHKLMTSGWPGQVLPTFRPDELVEIDSPAWPLSIKELDEKSGIQIKNFSDFINAIETRRAYFKDHGAVAADHGVETPFTCKLTSHEADKLFQKRLIQLLSTDDAERFKGYMLYEMARMSVEDGLVMQLHAGSYRNHNATVFEMFGSNLGFDIPVKVEWTRNLKPLLDAFGMDTRLRLILFTLDESSYSRELAPIAGAYPTVKLGPPWWFLDSPNGMARYFELVMETAGIENTVGFNDDSRNFFSIPARHDLWRRMSALWLAKLVYRGQLDMQTAKSRMADLAYRLVKRSYRLE